MTRAHDYQHLIARWRALARSLGLRLRLLARADDFPLYYLQTPALAATGGIYVSAGIHGDEPASTEALLVWAQRHAARLAGLPLLLFPCLNPWGLRNNVRLDLAGNDLNRGFHRDDLPQIAALKRVAAPFRFELAVMLHEDYDGQGIYIYEVQRHPPYWGEKLLAAAGRVIPIETRARVDAYSCRRGLVRRRLNMARFKRIGYPEAIWLHLERSERTFTVETPSEFAMEQRVEAHVAVLDEALRLAESTAAK